MIAWFLALARDVQIFYAIGFFSLSILLVQIAMMMIGIGGIHDVHGAVDSGGESSGLQLLSIRTLVAFGVGFGWAGAASLDAGLPLFPSCLIALVAGVALMLLVFFLMRSMLGMARDGTLDYQNAIGQVGTVYLPIPAANAGPGQIEVLIQGRTVIAQAFTKADKQLGNQSKVKVIALLDRTTLLVEPL